MMKMKIKHLLLLLLIFSIAMNLNIFTKEKSIEKKMIDPKFDEKLEDLVWNEDDKKHDYIFITSFFDIDR